MANIKKFKNMLCCGEKVIQLLVTLVHIMEKKSLKLIVIVKETFYAHYLFTYSYAKLVFSKNVHMHAYGYFLHI